jgi:hypothetical protein
MWSALEVVRHVVDMDLSMAERVNRVIVAERAVLPSPAAEQLRNSACVDARDLADEIAFLRAIRTSHAPRSLPA